MNRMRHANGLSGGVLALALCLGAALTSPEACADELPLFADDATIEMTLEAPLRTLSRNTRTRRWHDSTLSLDHSSGQTVALDVRVRIRGNSRLRECAFPPLRIDFRRSESDGTVFEGQKRLKLVTLCRRAERYRDYLALEHDVYRLFSELTPQSFRVRRASVTYVSTDGRGEQSFTEPAFFIEEDWEVAERHGLEVVEQERIALAELDPEHTTLVSLFHFLIGNTDWSVIRGPDEDVCCHNGKPITGAETAVIVLPYDFDQSGLIHTEYASPSDLLQIRSVTQRVYRGFCEFNQHVDAMVGELMGKRSALEGVLQSSSASPSAADEALEYLRESLAILEDHEERERQITGRCRS